MKYNTSYTPNTSLKETVIFTDQVKKIFCDFFNNKFKVIEILPVLFYNEDDSQHLESPLITRNIAFDTTDEYNINKVSLTQSAQLRKMISNLGLKNSEAIYVNDNSIWRDLPESPVSSISVYNLVLQVVIDDLTSDKIKKMANEVYGLCYEIAQKAAANLKIKNFWPNKILTVSSQQLDYEYSGRPFKEQEDEFVLEKDAFILENPGQTLLSGHIHTDVPKFIYDNDCFFQILMRDYVNGTALNVATISRIATGKILAEQIKELEISSDEELIKLSNQEIGIVEIRIALPQLVMAILKKGHISEVQPGVLTKESKFIKTHYRIENY